ncbi:MULTISPECIES: RNase H family protein [Bacillus cereus group]|uniref:RNase H family protein n=1 Tax=Bacillus cereus group TaxID=86661 RepID=UPI001298C956|nr:MULTISPECIES: RNase H family protein [Bacillus cereus group]MDR5047784.1 hypothetical protein [Bacillus thuringiensis]MEB9419875.1 hypothetical protein [Bacillus cereus]MRD20746.1 hypothetical protein [Bacillus thuringiensis]
MSKSQFDKMKVDLWVSGSVDQEKNGGWCSYLHSCINGQDYTKKIGGYAKDTTATRMTLNAILSALKLLKKDKPIIIHIYTSVAPVSAGLNKNMHKWASNNWLTSKGVYPQHLDLWQEIFDILTDSSRVIAFKVHLQNSANHQDHYRLHTISTSAEYLIKGKKDLYEVALV